LIPETLDVYERKNMPKVIFCLHAFALHLFKLGLAAPVRDLVGKVNFTEAELSIIEKELAKFGLEMPPFSKIGGVLTSDLRVDEGEFHDQRDTKCFI
jgi:Ras GTPase-activating-like protein IQGAP2/3